MSMAWEPDRRSNFFFSPPAHLCAVTYMTEISLIVTLNNQFNSTKLGTSLFNFLKPLSLARITDEGLVPGVRIWSILLIISDLKWCIHLSRSLFLYILMLISPTYSFYLHYYFQSGYNGRRWDCVSGAYSCCNKTTRDQHY